MNQPGQPWQQPMHPPAGDPFQQWAAQRGWRMARDVPGDVLGQLPGPPFHDYEHKAIPLLLAGLHEGMPALVMQIANSYKYTATTGSYYSTTTDRQVTTSKSGTATSFTSVAVLELSSPIPELLVYQRHEKPGGLLGMLGFGRSEQGPLATVQIGDPSRSLEAFAYQISGASPEYAQAVATPARLNWLYESFATYAGLDVQARPYFRFSGRKVMCWTGSRLFNPRAVDDLLGWARYLTSWIPPAAFQDPAAAEADRQHVPLSQLRLPLG
ncbi:hypothetical protein SAMN05216215_1011155 [Saccharopolyspora shandongensis]|uniref:Uncharacterized protein n=1 Tax=Saccharopolyspora shandongensis TaxID=418495 RepID=A0A1H3C3R9_9PSEU|nr:hypothetical protein [Saccharopolyspora shandongensis]SDX48139.1 hypothetical protein SAMN05216215_1011155 [Saccharopolyspora shandongensis]